MSYKPKPYTGALFANDKKKDTHPDWKGSVTLSDGQKLWVSGWDNKARDGSPYISLVLNKADEQPSGDTAPKNPLETAKQQPEEEIAF